MSAQDIAGAAKNNEEQDKYARAGCTPFVGAGLSSAIYPELGTSRIIEHLKEKLIMPLKENILKMRADNQPTRELEEQLEKEQKAQLRVPRKLNMITEYVAISKHESDRITVKSWLVEYIENITRNEPAENEKEKWNTVISFAELPFPVYITTNYDLLLEKALISANKHPKTLSSCWNKYKWSEVDKKTILSDLRGKDIKKAINNPVVFHIHGHIGDPSSMVLTEEDYLDFLVEFSCKNERKNKQQPPVIPTGIESDFMNQKLIFMGYSLEDINLIVLLQALRKTIAKSNCRQRISVQLFQDISIIRRLLDTITYDCLGKAQHWEKIGDSDHLKSEPFFDDLKKSFLEVDPQSLCADYKVYWQKYFKGACEVTVEWKEVIDFMREVVNEYKR